MKINKYLMLNSILVFLIKYMSLNRYRIKWLLLNIFFSYVEHHGNETVVYFLIPSPGE